MSQRERAISQDVNVYPRPNGVGGPVRLSAANYYFLTSFVSIAVFFIVWFFLHDGYDDTPLFVAAAAGVLCAASFVFVREVVGRRRRRRAIAAARLSQHLKLVGETQRRNSGEGKLTLKRNEQMLAEIRTKSEAAKVLGKFADAHKEVFDLCDAYLVIAASELSAAHPTSPRVSALRKGTVSATKRHRFHMLKWAEIKARSFTALSDGPVNLKIEACEEALDAVERAIVVYPEESMLTDSREVLLAFLTSAKIKLAVNEAEAAEENKDPERAVKHYEDALASLAKYDVNFEDRGLILEKIQMEISRIRQAG